MWVPSLFFFPSESPLPIQEPKNIYCLEATLQHSEQSGWTWCKDFIGSLVRRCYVGEFHQLESTATLVVQQGRPAGPQARQRRFRVAHISTPLWRTSTAASDTNLQPWLQACTQSLNIILDMRRVWKCRLNHWRKLLYRDVWHTISRWNTDTSM